MLIGRDPERRLVQGLLDDARRGVSAALVIRGRAGIGKTSVLQDAAAGAGMPALSCTGVESEHDVPFAGLQQLLRPVHELVERLPDPQAAALRTAFGLGLERVEDRLLLGLATLNLLAEATEEGPLLCTIDDLQWLDGPSAEALLFAARRLGAEGIVMLFAVRDDPARWFEIGGLQQLTLAPLPEAAARALVAGRRGAAITPAELDRLLREAEGNPLALLELPVGGAAGADAEGIEAAFRARALALPAPARRLLLLAAVTESGEIATWSELARLADVPAEARRAAVVAGLIGDLDTVVFRHPLVRSAVAGVSSGAERAEAHLLLAEGSSEPLARAGHLAAAAVGPDEALAAQLEAAAVAASDRGGFASAGAALARAAALSPGEGPRAHRLLEAARAYLDAGDSELSARLAAEARLIAHTAADRAELAAVVGALEVQRGMPGTAYDVLLEAARTVAPDDPGRALALHAQAIGAAFVAGWPERAFVDAAAFVRELPPTGTTYELFLRKFLDAVTADEADDRARARERLLQALRSEAPVEDFRFAVWAGLASAYLGDLRSAREHCLRLIAAARAAGSFNTLPLALLGVARLGINLRDFDEAEESAREGIDLTRQLGQKNLETAISGILVRCLAARGRIEECRELGERTLRRALIHGNAVAVADVRLGLAELELSLGNGAAARELIEEVTHPLLLLGATPELVEARLLSGDADPGRSAVDALAAHAHQAQDPHLLGAVARSCALSATSPEKAEQWFLEALHIQTRHSQPFERARTQLAFGQFLRRAQRRMEARVYLREALATFEGLDTPLWAERARGELEATGITARRRDASTLDDLTPQELRIAKLVAAGASNRDAAAQLFISQKTVEYHLRKVFLKLGVSSRVELAHRPLQAVAD